MGDNHKNVKLMRDTLQVKRYQTNRLGWMYEEKVDSWRMVAYKHRADGAAYEEEVLLSSRARSCRITSSTDPRYPFGSWACVPSKRLDTIPLLKTSSQN